MILVGALVGDPSLGLHDGLHFTEEHEVVPFYLFCSLLLNLKVRPQVTTDVNRHQRCLFLRDEATYYTRSFLLCSRMEQFCTATCAQRLCARNVLHSLCDYTTVL